MFAKSLNSSRTGSYSRLIGAVVSLPVVAFGQPAWWGGLGLVAAIVGYALFWRGLDECRSVRLRFMISSLWFFAVQLVQLSWMTAYEYVGIELVALYFVLAIAMGLQFGFVTLLLPYQKVVAHPWLRLASIAALWTVMEWLRLFVVCGFTFNPVGLAWTSSLAASQTLSLTGIYGLSFWAIWVNLLAWYCQKRKGHLPSQLLFLGCAALPFIYGSMQLAYLQQKKLALPESKLNVLLVQTALLPEQKLPCSNETRHLTLTPHEQWVRILETLGHYSGRPVDLIVMPEAVVPYGTIEPVSRHSDVQQAFQEHCGLSAGACLPPLEPPFARWIEVEGYEPFWAVSNAYWAQAFANFFQAEVVLGLEDFENGDTPDLFKSYQAAFHFAPYSYRLARYEKQILVPMAEYLPFSWCEDIAKQRGLVYFYEHGTDPKVFFGKMAMGMAICYEETFGDLMRHNRKLGAEMLINVSNDVWYPQSKLAKQHFDLGRLRAIENGIPLVRSCNSGVTGAVDSCGRILASIDENDAQGALYTSISKFNYETLYTRVGDALIVTLSLLLLLTESVLWLRKKWQKACKKSV